MTDNTFYTDESMQGQYKLFDLGDFVLEEDHETLRGAKLAYRTFGHLNQAKDNAVLVTTWFSGTGKIMEDVYIGANHALDPATYFIIVVDQIGSGTSSSPNNTPVPQSHARFPKVRIGDDVRAQHKLVTELFGIDSLALVVGGSMGGQQVYEWAVRYPSAVRRAAPIAATARISHHQVIFTQSLQEALTSDPNWNDGWYKAGTDVRTGMGRMAKIVANLGWSAEFYQEERWRTVLGMSSPTDFINGVMKAYFDPMDPNTLLAQIWKWQRADVSRHTGGDIAAALGRIEADTLVLPISHDLFFPPHEHSADHALIPNSELRVIESKEGHFALNGFEPNYMGQVDGHLRDLLAR
ncbi:alpha/beta fold hydrolase [Pseudarthrobacter sp. HLT3-5]|uniref:alpha/beta fold hydrolase n=1 Tax=Pseudarthrobacter cellobiosi TaxID=2953654 RepID=UPI00208F2BCE|nr:alpha/beta fold hydrolase [Pseudarthrobacter sp. HLT3-5]MCO4276015.1 alpha/beta fold hydrolase [Pseudarthrobacter sp. HLT3-5]